MPMVRAQVSSQIKVRDMSSARVSIAPSEYSGWSEARSELMAEAKGRLKAKLEATLSNLSTSDVDSVRQKFLAEERDLEHKVDHEVHTFNASFQVSYNFLSR